ncbi:MAG: sulfite exporter TauE/SafE family protein [Euryarchaeota archaeon]|nr:sulfite exporter TauE/SafE family protein [Euryarchaeota archaeon]
MVWMVALGSSFAHSGEGHANKEVANAGRLTAIPAAIIGSFLAWLAIEYVSVLVIKVIAAAILIYVIERNLRPSEKVTGGVEVLTKYKIGCAFGGLASGLLGIGGGAVYVTINRRMAGLDIRDAAGTSYLIGAAVVPVALLSHILIDGTLPDVYHRTGLLAAIIVPVLAFCSAYIGAKNAIKHLPINIVKWIFLVAVGASLGRYLWDIGSNLL